jgi:hypothetical protein
MKHNQIMLKNPIIAQKTDFKDYHFCGAFVEKKFLTIKNEQIVAVHWKLAENYKLETLGEIFQCSKELAKEAAAAEQKRLADLKNKHECEIMVALLRKDEKKLRELGALKIN